MSAIARDGASLLAPPGLRLNLDISIYGKRERGPSFSSVGCRRCGFSIGVEIDFHCLYCLFIMIIAGRVESSKGYAPDEDLDQA